MHLQIGSGEQTYEWIGDWAKIPNTESARTGWAHPGMTINGAGEIVTFHPGEPRLLVFDPEGNLLRTAETSLTEGHWITVVREGDAEYLWIADTDAKRYPQNHYAYGAEIPQGQVVKMTMDGETVAVLPRPELPTL